MYANKLIGRPSSRREFIKGAAAGAFLLAFYVPARAVNEPEQAPDDTRGKFAPNAFIRIDKTGTTTPRDAAGGNGAGRVHRRGDDLG